MTFWQTLLFISTLIAGGGFVVTLAWWLFDYTSGQRRFRKSLDIRLFRVSVPKATIKQEQSTQDVQQVERETISVIEQFLAGVASLARDRSKALSGANHITFELVVQHNEISFYLAVPGALADLLEKQLHAVYPQAVVEPAEEYNIFIPRIGHAVAARLKTKKSFEWPLRTYQQLESDPLNVLTNSLSKVSREEGAIIQVVFKPAKEGWRKKVQALAKKIQTGKQSIAGSTLKDALGGVFESSEEKTKREQRPLTPLVDDALKAVSAKAAKAAFEVNVRLVASSPQREAAAMHVRNLVSAFEQFNLPNLNGFIPVEPKDKRGQGQLITQVIFRTFAPGESVLLSSEELGSFMHLPDSRFVETPDIVWVGARTAPAPARLPTEGRLIGHNVFRGVKRPFMLPREDRRRHMYIVGKTGTGKTTLLKNMIREDIEAGEGVAFLDPHGDAVEEILQTIPKHRIDDVIVFRPGDTERPVGLNMLEYESEDLKDYVVGEMIAIFYKLFPPEIIGPMFEHNMRNVMLTLMEDKEQPGTIAEIPRMFSDERYQRYKAAKVTDPVVRSFWENEMAKTSDFHKSEMLGYLISKVGRFVENRMMRNIIGQAKSGFNFRDIMDNKKIFLANLSKGEMGDINSNLIGMILVAKIQMAALSRVNMAQDTRPDFYLYIDEFQNFTTDSIPTVLSEARKYRLNLILAHQFITQVKEEVRDAIFGNVGAILTYRVGAQDAEVLEKEFDPVFTANDIVNLGFAQAYIKATTQKTALPAFSLQIPAPWEITYPARVRPKVAAALKQFARLKYGRDRAVVEQEIAERGRIAIA
ncbi:MAG: type IV secretion system DNA-binding domain-containing protein [Candidatus Andersenbacteria bacterium]